MTARAILGGAGVAATTAAYAAPLLLISIDGLRPGDVLQADARGLHVPNLRRFVDHGAYAAGVVGVLPTLTYPSHTTLITGVAPLRHGIVNNLTFDPTNINQVGWYWYSSDIRVPTLWDAAHAAGRVTANVHWPVSVGAAIDYNLPQIWRTGHADDRKLMRVVATPGLVVDLERRLGPYTQGIDESVEGDVDRTRFALALLGEHHPGFMTVYLTGLDHIQHLFGPDTPQAHAALERIDGLVGELMAAAPGADVAVVSDHGFTAIDTDINLFGAFIRAGLITLDGTKVKSWEAVPWFAGGSAAIVMARRDDPVLRAKVAGLLADLRANPATHIAAVLDHAELVRRGAGDAADWMVEFAPGTEMGRDPAAALVAPSTLKGMHGYDPMVPAMRSTFLLMGPDVKLRGDLGVIDMRQIAPTLAALMHAPFPGADLPALVEKSGR
ncbi:alkaline phosphatase family protein [Polymorphobacter megasporae]|uniref:alkaline phosphatase family protein n=1 Tax=Glacieibacterium megasporae TaxID=2835787 RepID=UPI001C1E5668|nr:ectonucleotide pyrophosphatase/phosphodiesterase [Polymorphobacter megasporae]UAJ12021.1 ectonucleotide pyrophosphatase/phosphodiesterase [Polymorphobacter megasporae]